MRPVWIFRPTAVGVYAEPRALSSLFVVQPGLVLNTCDGGIVASEARRKHCQTPSQRQDTDQSKCDSNRLRLIFVSRQTASEFFYQVFQILQGAFSVRLRQKLPASLVQQRSEYTLTSGACDDKT